VGADTGKPDKPFPLSRTRVYKMYYTFCEDPGCGAINDYADTREDAEANRRRHVAKHRAFEAGKRELHPGRALG
jgi:hypothetical protein